MNGPPLAEALDEARRLGLLGPGPVADHVAHAEGFTVAAPSAPGRFLDLGSGGGVPGLVLALAWPAAEVVLLDGSERRAAFLRRAVLALGLGGRVVVVAERAEVAGRSKDWRASFDRVVARAFGSPAVTAECAAPFLAVGGDLLVSDPPDGEDRWPVQGLARLGLVPQPQQGAIRRLVQEVRCPEQYPRRRPGRPPLF
ncbi:MAG: rRNA (guanine527-N7)-methyltransferase [Actinomycetota bacterium]